MYKTIERQFPYEKSKNMLNNLDREQKVYRIFPLKRFEEILSSQELVLVRPSMWDDPFENFFLSVNVLDTNGKLGSLQSIKDSWYGQCWTTNADTDAMWRIYSPNKDGVRVSTTVGKLFNAIYDQNDEWASLKYFIVKVEYKTKQEISTFMQNTSFWNVAIGGQNDGFAKLLCVKREAFDHENEVRVLVSKTPDEMEKNNSCIYQIKIDFEKLFDDICLDPRLSDSEYQKLRCGLISKTKLSISQSDLYKFDLQPIRLD
jgi:hypothetical protein